MGRVKDCLNGDELLDNYDIAKLLNVSLRTVARYREKRADPLLPDGR